MTNAAFYDEIMGNLEISKNTVQRYLGAFAKIGIVNPLYDSGRYGMLYADGYFRQMPNDKYKKASFIKNDPKMREGLRRVPELLRGYSRVRVQFQI
jgi:predicted transcriptional regulator